MTPDEARDMLEGTTPGPWYLSSSRSVDGIDIVMYDDTVMERRNIALAAAAPVLAAIIAGMRPEYRAEYQAAGGRWFPVPHCCNCGGEEWGTKEQAERNAAAWKADDYAVRVVRRYVTEPEEA